MTTFYICRHGETENNKNQKLSGWLDSPLTALGVENVHTTVSKIRGVHFDSIQSSDLGRAAATADLIAEELDFKGSVFHSRALREVNYGDWAGMTYKETVTEFSRLDLGPHKMTNYVPPNGESLRDMQKRVLEFLNNLSQHCPDQTILVTAHDGTIKAVYAAYAQIDLGQHDADLEYAHDFVGKFTIENGRISSFGEVG